MDEARRLSFGSVADLYHRWRPSYPAELVDDVVAFAQVTSPRVLDIGAGTGKATLLFAPRASSVLALEPAPEMAAAWRRECGALANASLEEVEFERWHQGERTFEIVIAAQAWHWVEPELRTSLARAALVDGGALALFWNQPVWNECELADRLAAAYAEVVPEFRSQMGPMHPAHSGPPPLLGDYARELDRAPGFDTVDQRQYRWTRCQTTAEYLAVIGTHSDHVVLPDDARTALFDAVAAVIDSSGGSLALPYSTHLSLARAI